MRASLVALMEDGLAQLIEPEQLEDMLSIKIEHSQVVSFMKVVSNHGEVTGVPLLDGVDWQLESQKFPNSLGAEFL